MFLDAHAHLDLYDESIIDKVLDQIHSRRIYTLSVAMDPSSYSRNLELSEKSRFIVPAFGIHPWNASEYISKLDQLKPLIDRSPILGEIGLDYKFVEDVFKYQAQRYVFEYFLKAAKNQNKIINLHTAGAENEVLVNLGCYGITRAIVHWYSGPLEILAEYVKRGLYITVGAEILKSGHIQDVCRMIPDHLLLTETDNPGGYKWLVGEPGMPPLIETIIDKIAEVRNSDSITINSLVWRNFQTLIKDDQHLKINIDPTD
jgi:TatD DNase family protein